jgi:DNA polymerase elongation subunit (family B)
MPEKIQFFVLDATYRIVDDKANIYLFGRTVDGKQICVVDDSFEPYFYVIPKKEAKVKEKLEKIKIERREGIAEVVRTEAVSKKFLGKEIEAIKVYTKLPRDVPLIREVIKDWTILESVNEYDILFVRRYLIDKGIIPMTLVEAEGDFITQKSKVPVLKATKVEQFSDDTLHNPRILAIDIETYNPDGKGINTEKNPIIMMALYGKNFKKIITWKRFKAKEDIEFVDSEVELLEKFKEIIDGYKPDMIAGYYSDGFDLPYIEARAKKYKIKLDIGLDFSEIKVNRRAITVTSRIMGIPHIDIFKFITRILRGQLDTELYGLGDVAQGLIGEKKVEVDLDNLSEAWDNNKGLDKFVEYNLHDAHLTFKLTEKMMPNLVEMVKIIGLPIYDINRMGFSQLIEWYLLRNAISYDEIAPESPHSEEIKQRRMQTFKGAFVFEPKPGMYKDIVIFDYRSLYPSIISSHNISPGTLNCDCCRDKAKLAPTEDKEQKYWFCTKRKGFIPIMIEDIVKRRMRILEIIKKEKTNPILEARSQSLKLLANSFYGYLGFFGARWYSIECSRATTAYGRYYIHSVIDKAKESGFNVIYSDTDSVFLALGDKTKKDADKFAEEVNLKLPGVMELEYEGFYSSGIFVSAKVGAYGAKKKYALVSKDGNLKIRGFETVRRNWSDIAKDVQEEVLKIILQEKKPEKAFSYVRSVTEDLRKHKIPLNKVIIHTKLQKEIGSYDNIGPHVAVANRMKKQGADISAGVIVRYVITKGKEKIRDRAKLPNEVKQSDYDPDYYINNQVVPAVEKIFEVLGYNKEELLQKEGQKKLAKFF